MKKILKSVCAIIFAALTFTSCDDVPMPYPEPTVTSGKTIEGATGDGTLGNPYNVAGVLQYISTLESGVESEIEVYVTGTVASIATDNNGTVQNYDTSGYGSATFDITDGKNLFTVYRAYYLGNKKWTAGAGDPVKVGDEVVVYGKVVNFKGTTPETVNNQAYLYSLNGQGGGSSIPAGEPAGDGSATSPFNVAAAIAKCKEIGQTESTEKYYVKGLVAAEATADASFGNITFGMVDAEGGEQFTAFQVCGTGGAKLPGTFKVVKGDEVVVYGPIYNYKGNTPETAGKSAAQIVTVNGKGTDDGGSSSGGGQPSGDGTAASPYNVAKVLEYTKALAADVESGNDVYVKGKISSIKYTYSSQYGTATYNISDDGKESNVFTVYGSYYLDNKPYVDGQTNIQVGDEVVVCGKVVNYKGDTPEFANKKNWLVSLNSGGGSSSGGGEVTPTSGNATKTVDGTTITLIAPNAAEGSSVTVDLSAQGFENGKAATTITLNDGTTISFDKGANTNAPAFYDATKGVRVYAQNSIIINGSKAIAKVVLTCDEYNGTKYVGNAQLYGNVSGNVFTICNDNTEPKGGVQLRVQTIVITYVK